MARQQVMLRAVTTKNKPDEMLAASPKGTIPVLVLPDSNVIDESLDIMLWALQQNDPENLLHSHEPDDLTAMIELVRHNDKIFKPQLEIYKKAKRFHMESEIEERQKCEVFISELERRLVPVEHSIKELSKEDQERGYFIGQSPSLIDYALLPFVRQFSRVNRAWFIQAPYPNLRAWLAEHQQSRVYAKAMAKYPLWLDKHEESIFGEA